MLPEHQMALITSVCVPFRLPGPGRAELGWGFPAAEGGVRADGHVLFEIEGALTVAVAFSIGIAAVS